VGWKGEVPVVEGAAEVEVLALGVEVGLEWHRIEVDWQLEHSIRLGANSSYIFIP
jgi:hypothetical protein